MRLANRIRTAGPVHGSHGCSRMARSHSGCFRSIRAIREHPCTGPARSGAPDNVRSGSPIGSRVVRRLYIEAGSCTRISRITRNPHPIAPRHPCRSVGSVYKAGWPEMARQLVLAHPKSQNNAFFFCDTVSADPCSFENRVSTCHVEGENHASATPSSRRTTGATRVPSSSTARIIFACGSVPTPSWSSNRWWLKSLCWNRILSTI